LKYFDDRYSWMKDRDAQGVFIKDGWIENFNESFPDFAGKRFAFYWTIRDLINLEFVREKPDNSYNFERLLGRAPDAESASARWQQKAVRKEDLRSRNLIALMDLEITDFGKAFLEFITDPIQSSSKASNSIAEP